MDENELADILQNTNHFQVSHEIEEEHEIVFEGSEEDAEEDLFKDSEGDYEPEDKEDISLEENDQYGEEEDNQGRRRTVRVRVPPQSWKHLQEIAYQTEEYIS